MVSTRIFFKKVFCFAPKSRQRYVKRTDCYLHAIVEEVINGEIVVFASYLNGVIISRDKHMSVEDFDFLYKRNTEHENFD